MWALGVSSPEMWDKKSGEEGEARSLRPKTCLLSPFGPQTAPSEVLICKEYVSPSLLSETPETAVTALFSRSRVTSLLVFGATSLIPCQSPQCGPYLSEGIVISVREYC